MHIKCIILSALYTEGTVIVY